MRSKLFCKNCKKRIINPKSQYQQFCEECIELNKSSGGIINIQLQEKIAIENPPKPNPKEDRIEFAKKIITYMREELKVPKEMETKVIKSVGYLI